MARRTKIITPAGRTLYRHSSDLGCVLEFTIRNIPIFLFVMDAIYRFTAKWGMYNTASGLTGVSQKNTKDNYYMDGIAGVADDFVFTDAQLDALWSTKIDPNTAKQNCDVWMRYTGVTTTGEDGVAIKGVPAVQGARALNLNGTPCNVPNYHELQRIFCEAANIDSIDPTLEQAPQYALWTSNPNGRWKLGGGGGTANVWSSTTSGDYSCVTVYNNGQCTHKLKSYVYGVIPVVELPGTDWTAADDEPEEPEKVGVDMAAIYQVIEVDGAKTLSPITDTCESTIGRNFYVDVPISQIPADVIAALPVGQFVSAPSSSGDGTYVLYQKVLDSSNKEVMRQVIESGTAKTFDVTVDQLSDADLASIPVGGLFTAKLS